MTAESFTVTVFHAYTVQFSVHISSNNAIAALPLISLLADIILRASVSAIESGIWKRGNFHHFRMIFAMQQHKTTAIAVFLLEKKIL